MADLPDIAIVADAHLHDIHSDYGCNGTVINSETLTLRSWKDSRRSSRLFNESRDALEATLDDIARRNVRHVVLLGDYTDDGQIESTQRFVRIIRHYQDRYSMAFYAIPGNHDVYGPLGKHQSTRYMDSSGGSILVTSDPEVAGTEDSAVLTRKMYCEGLPAGLLPMANFGLYKQAEYIHWETPFGHSDAPESRMFDAHSADGSVTHSLMDASYLVEPCDGLWLLMLDATVYEPRNGKTDPARKNTFINSSDAGWNSVLRVKPFLFDWIKDVCERAEVSGKRLYTFSHYPIINTIDNETTAETLLFGENEVMRRTPDEAVAQTLLSTGLKLHFSGHMHVNNEAQVSSANRTLTNIAVPSLVGFPAGYKLINSGSQSPVVNTVLLDDTPINPSLIAAYKVENKAAGNDDEAALSAKNYGEFLYLKSYTRVLHRYLERDWPKDIANQIEHTTIADLAYFMLDSKIGRDSVSFGAMKESVTPESVAELDALTANYNTTREAFNQCSMLTLLADWYCLRQAGPFATRYIADQKLTLYACIASTALPPEPQMIDTHHDYFNVFLNVLRRSLDRLDINCSPPDTIV